MGRGYRFFGGTAAVLGAASLVCALLTLLPGLLLPESGWLTGVSVGSAFLFLFAAALWGFSSVSDRRMLWTAFRCLPGKAQTELGMLVAGGVALTAVTMLQGLGRPSSPKVEGGRHYAHETAPRGWVEILSRAEYEALVELEQRLSHGISSLVLGIAAALFLSMGELRKR